MLIEESVLIDAGLELVWGKFTDISCWKEWSRTLTDVSYGSFRSLTEGEGFRFCIRPFFFPVDVSPTVVEVEPRRRVVWAASGYGVFARHEFLFEEDREGVRLTSRETFSGPLAGGLRMAFLEERIREMTVSMLREFKESVEGLGRGRKD